MSNNISLRYKSLLLIIILCSTFQIILWPWSKIAKADMYNTDWSWTTAKPTVFSSTKISSIDNWCANSFQIKEVADETDTKMVCMSTGDKTRFGVYYNGRTFTAVVGFLYDSKMYKVNGACTRYDSCTYLPGSDTLVTKQYLMNGYVHSLVVYRNFTRRLTLYTNASLPISQYNFDTSNPDYIFQSANDFAWPVGGIGASNNGQWLAIEFRQRGIGLLNVETLEMRRISNMAFSYGAGYDPASELSVSNDGKHVAIMGMNSGLTVSDITSSCGDEATDSRMESNSPIAQPCAVAQVSTGEFIHNFVAAVHPIFNDDGGELSFYAASRGGESLDVSLRAAGYDSKKLSYLALGDSFTSGEGETDDKYYLQGTNDEFEKCHVSFRSYPFLISDFMKIDPLDMASVACSGAETKDIIGDDASYLGQGERLGEKYMKLDDIEITLAQNEAKRSFLPGRVHQESFVKKYQPKVITVGIGGNDAGFMSKLKACLGLDTCGWASNSKDKEQTAVEIKSLFSTLVNTYQEIHNASPNSKIYVIGYPRIIDANEKCSLLNGYLLDGTERQFMNEGITYLNQVIAAAAQASGVKFIDTEDSYGDQVLCGKSKPSAMNAIRLGDDGAIYEKLGWFKPVGNESFHPNSLGHAFTSNSINNSVSDLTAYDYCSDGSVMCPDSTSIAPEPSSYWIPDVNHNYPDQKVANYISDKDDASDSLHKRISLDSNSLTPNSFVDVEITSDPISLGKFTADNDGSLNIDINLPADLDEGYHTIHLYGTSYSGESIELYQVFAYGKTHVAINKNPGISGDNVVNNTGSLLTNSQKTNIKAGGLNNVIAKEINQVESALNSTPKVDEAMVLGTSVIADRSPELTNNSYSKAAKSTATNKIVILPLAIFIVIGAIITRLVQSTRVR